MRLLLDTHVVLWAMLDDARLGPDMRRQIGGAEALYISAVSVWEVAIKAGLGKLTVPPDLFERAQGAGALPLAVTWAHAQAVRALPPHHADPFDRLLIAQAQLEGLTLVSADRAMAAYEVALIGN